jgi:hypothetical protein
MSADATNGNNRAYDSAVLAAELVRQNALAGTPTQAAVNTATIVYHRALVKAAIANGVSPAASMQALKELGQTGA